MSEPHELPTWEDMRSEAFGMLGDVLDVLRADWRPGEGPGKDEMLGLRRARDHIAAAKQELERGR